ncbi:MAG TPA: potassium channel family protein [Thermohalobaculum sp.]|nr:potassium channel family protein [Thermohalobaculum sp.]
MGILLAIALVIFSVVATTGFHYEALRLLLPHAHRRRTPRIIVMTMLTGLVAVHFAEIMLYAAVFSIGAGPLSIGGFDGVQALDFLSIVHFAAETYSTLGYGDIVPTGNLRLIAGAEALNGLLLLTWSGSALFILVQDIMPALPERTPTDQRRSQ